MRNPNWHRDEIILALDLYFSPDRGAIDKRNPKIIEFSRFLRSLPFYPNRPEPEKFRNPEGVTYKLLNLAYHDPNYDGGMANGSELDKIVFYEFANNQEVLKEVAGQIRKIVTDSALQARIQAVEEDDEVDGERIKEGNTLYKWHKVIERNRRIVERKKKRALRLFGELACEVCKFNFKQAYGPLGDGFIECHHRTPLAELKVASETSLEDLALVCANCHRMLHKKIDVLSIDALKEVVNAIKGTPAA